MGKHDYMKDTVRQMNEDRLMNTSFFRGFMNDRVPMGSNRTFIKGFGPMLSNEDFVSATEITERQNNISEIITAAEWAILTDTNITSPKSDIVRYVAILQKLITAGAFDRKPNDGPVGSTGAVWFNPSSYTYNAPIPNNIPSVPNSPFMNGMVQPVYGCPVQTDIMPKDADVWEQIEKSINTEAGVTETETIDTDTDKISIFDGLENLKEGKNA